LEWAEILVYIYINIKLLQEQPNVNPTTWYEKNMLSKCFMFDVDKSEHEGNTLEEDPK
jgi:hypothetical protein